MNPLIDVANLVIGVLALIVVSVTLGYVIKQDKREKARQNEAADETYVIEADGTARFKPRNPRPDELRRKKLRDTVMIR